MIDEGGFNLKITTVSDKILVSQRAVLSLSLVVGTCFCKRLINSTYGLEEARTFLSTNCGRRFLKSWSVCDKGSFSKM